MGRISLFNIYFLYLYWYTTPSAVIRRHGSGRRRQISDLIEDAAYQRNSMYWWTYEDFKLGDVLWRLNIVVYILINTVLLWCKLKMIIIYTSTMLKLAKHDSDLMSLCWPWMKIHKICSKTFYCSCVTKIFRIHSNKPCRWGGGERVWLRFIRPQTSTTRSPYHILRQILVPVKTAVVVEPIKMLSSLTYK